MAGTSFLGKLSKADREDLIKRLHKLQEGRCYISGEPIDLKVHEVDLDHIIAIARGGPDDETNIGLALAHHNRSKGVRDLELQRRIFSFYRDLRLHTGQAPTASMFTVAEVLQKIRSAGQAVSVTRMEPDLIRIAWTSITGKPLTLELSTIVDDSADPVVRYSCFGRLPPEIVHHSDLNPRSIHDLEPMIEEFYYRHPQMQPSLAYFQPLEIGQTAGRIMLFDGQHKAAAQLYNQCEGILCRVFLPPAGADIVVFEKFIDEIRRTNFRAHTKLA